MFQFEPFIWKSEPPEGIPFEPSDSLHGLRLLGRGRHYKAGDTWYPSWGEDDVLYSGYTDGTADGIRSISDAFTWVSLNQKEFPFGSRKATTGNAAITGDDPLNLEIKAQPASQADPYPYGGRYPCAYLMHNGVWYYGTYCLSPFGITRYGDKKYNWPWMGPFIGFRTSTDKGESWKECPHTPEQPIFGETGLCGYPVKIGSPHFVDFGKNMMHSPDGKAYLVAHGSDLKFYPVENFAHLSWITGDQVYLIRVTPSPETINDPEAYEFFAGYDDQGNPIWVSDFKDIQPLLEWQNNMGCVTMTYNAPLRKYIMAVTDGRDTVSEMNTYLLESDHVTGPFKLITYMKHFGVQAYFVNFPSKFISPDGRTMWMCYSGNFSSSIAGRPLNTNPPGSHYGMVLQEVELL